jgi:hypothetical protein
LGRYDQTAIWFTQTVGQELRIIDFAQGRGKSLADYVRLVKEKPYVYGRHVAPHDIEITDYTSDKSRWETACQLGIRFEIVPKISVQDGIDAVRNIFSRCWFDAEKCADGINSLKNYRKRYDEKRKAFDKEPYHDWSSDAADAFRMLAVSYDWRRRGLPSNPPDKYARRLENIKGGGSGGISLLG